MTVAQINIVNDCNDAMRYFSSRATDAKKGYLPGNLDCHAIKAVVSYCEAEFHQHRMIRDFVRFGR